uniref:Uncharacterized protein n=1 Tax=Trypanosoma vivax (strain Y486) TaxID=1055687 RepID=G0U923_TRYVY|nr:conserved hypothetical protein [Trypanosoma vivax Y486]
MFRYHIEVLECEWSGKRVPTLPDGWVIEVRCHRRGARCCMNSFPTEMVVRSAPEAEQLSISVMREGNVHGTSEMFDIGGLPRSVGVRTVPVKTGEEGTEAVLCAVRLMWSVKGEDGSVFSRFVEDFSGVVSGGVVSASALADSRRLQSLPSTQRGSLDDRPLKNLEGLCSEDQMMMGQGSAQKQGNRPCETKSAPFSETPQGGVPRDSGAQWCVGTPQYAPEGILNYFITSTQTVKPPKAWGNIYTSPSPLLVGGARTVEEVSRASTPQRLDPMCKIYLPGFSALGDILAKPTRAPPASGEELSQFIVSKKCNIPWRKNLSLASDAFAPKSTRQ